MSTLLLADKERNKRVNKVEKLHQKAIYLSKKIDKAQWKQVLFGNDSEKLREWQKEEASINTKIANVRADMLKKIQNPLELFPAVQVAWHAAKFGLLHLLQAHVRTPGALEYRELSSQTTVLHVAAYFGNLDCVQFLAQANADVNATNSHGSTPLHCAAEQHHAEVVAFLLSLPQVDPYLRNTAGLLPTHIVRKGASLLGDKYGRFAKCSRALDARCAVIHGWLFESRRDTLLNRLVLENVGLKAHSWHQRYVYVLRTNTASTELEFVAYETTAPSACPAVPLWVAVYHMGDPITSPIPKRNLSNKPHTFSFDGLQTFPAVGAAHIHTKTTFEFAALSEEGFSTWMQFFEHAFIDASVMALPATSRPSTAHTDRPSSSSLARLSRAPSAPVEEQVDQLFSSTTVTQQVPYEELFPSTTVVLPVAKTLTVVPPSPTATSFTPSAPDLTASLLIATAAPAAPHANECVVCFDNPKEGVCVPCGHHAVCMTCAGRLLNQPSKTCPVCRGDVREIIRMYRC